MENYKVVSITDREGNPRTDGRYPDRVGRICTKPNVRIGEQMVIQWISNAMVRRMLENSQRAWQSPTLR